MVDHIGFYRNLRKNLSKDVLILAGPEQYPARRIVEDYAESLGAKPKTVWVDGRSVGEILEDILKHTAASMFERHVAWVRFLPTSSSVVKTVKELLNNLAGVKGVVISTYEEAKSFSSYESDRVLLVNMRPLKASEFEAWVLKRFKREGERVSVLRKRPDLKALLLDYLPKNLTEAEMEIKKLLLYSDTLEREALNLLWKIDDLRIYDVSRKVQEGDSKGALELLKRLQEAGTDPSVVLGQLIRDMTNLAYVKAGLLPPFAKNRHYVRKILKEIDQRITENELRKALDHLKETELLFRTVLSGRSRWAQLKIVAWKIAEMFQKPWKGVSS